MQDRDKAKSFFIFGHHPKLNIAGGGSGRAQFKQFPAEIPLRLNLVQGFENKDKLDGNNKFMTELVFFPTGHGHRILQVGLKLIELVIEGNLVVFSDSNPDNDERRNIIKEFEKLAYGGVDKSGALFP